MNRWVLVHELSGKPAIRGEIVADFRGDEWELLLGNPPAHEGSSGRVYCKQAYGSWKQELFPSVVGLKWIIEES